MKDILSDVSSATFYKRVNGRLVEVDVNRMPAAPCMGGAEEGQGRTLLRDFLHP